MIDTQIHSLQLSEKLKIHAIPTGIVKVKRAHRGNGWGLFHILIDFAWTEAMPIYTWLIEHPEGLILVDTGENVRVNEKNYFDCDPQVGWVNRKILKIGITEDTELPAQLASLGYSVDDIHKVVLTHLHLDHVDGLHFFPKADFLVSKTEFQNPYGAMPCLWPKWFKPQLIEYTESDPYFEGRFTLTEAGDIYTIPTPGHTHGHQSIMIQTADLNVMIAGDLAFSQKQLKQGQAAGICVSKKQAKATYQQVEDFSKKEALLFLPSHDRLSGQRLAQKEILEW